MSYLDLWSFAATVTSIVLAIGAIALSVIFFRMSLNEARRSKESSDLISASVDKLEKLFDRLYQDTFSEMRENNQWMRDRQGSTYSSDESDLEARIKSQAHTAAKAVGDELKADLTGSLTTMLEGQGVQADAIEELRKEFAPLLDRAVDGSKRVALLEDLSKSEVWIMSKLEIAQEDGMEISVREFYRTDEDDSGPTDDFIMSSMFSLRRRKLITWSGKDDRISPRTQISLTNQGRRVIASAEH